MLMQARAEALRLRRRLERRELECVAHRRQVRVLWVVTILIAVGFAADLWFGFHENVSNVSSVAPSPSAQALPNAAVGSASTGLNATIPPVNVPVEESETKDVSNVPQITPAAPLNDGAKPERTAKTVRPGTLSLADSVTRTRTDFVLPLNKTSEVVPGIFLTVRENGVNSQQIDGWLQLAEESRTVPIRGQSLQTLATFTTKHDERKRAVVFTRVDKNQAAGYLLIPLPVG
jgi:hypothetical protein